MSQFNCSSLSGWDWKIIFVLVNVHFFTVASLELKTNVDSNNHAQTWGKGSAHPLAIGERLNLDDKNPNLLRPNIGTPCPTEILGFLVPTS